MATSTPELGMDKDEAETVAKAYLDMQRHYAPVVSGKMLDTMRFCMVAATVYGGRIVRVNSRKKAEALEKRVVKPVAAPAASVLSMVPKSTPANTKPAQAPQSGNGHDAASFHYGMMAGQPLEDTHE